MKKGFTLAEVLITLAVIGVVATLTMPNLIGNYQNRVLITQLQKTLNTVANGVSKAMEERTAERFSDVVNSHDTAISFLKTYFDTISVCQHSDDGGNGMGNCLAPTYTSFDKQKSATADSLTSMRASVADCAATTSGATICVYPYHFGGTDEGNTFFMIDVNGIKSPNVHGKDLFLFRVLDNGKLAYSFAEVDKELKANMTSSNSEEAAEAQAQYNAKMQEEADGTSCKTNEIDLTNACLPYIISHGWEFKF